MIELIKQWAALRGEKLQFIPISRLPEMKRELEVLYPFSWYKKCGNINV